MSDQSQSWCYREGSTVVGPLDAKALSQLHEAGVISDATEVARAGSEEWTRFPDAVLVEIVAPEPLPPPPVTKPLLRRDESVVILAKEDSQPLISPPPATRLEDAPLPPVPPPGVKPSPPTPPPHEEARGVAPTVKLEDVPQAKPLPPVPPASAAPAAATPAGELIRIPCKACGGVIEASAYDIGLQVPCPGCGGMATVPAVGVVTSFDQTTPGTANLIEDATWDDGSPVDGLQSVVPTWQVRFSSLLTGASGSGFAREGHLRIENRNLVFEGWKLWNKPLRVVIGILLALCLMWICLMVVSNDDYSRLEKFIVRVFLDEVHQQRPYPDWVLIAVFLVNVILFYVIPVYLAVLVSSNYLALPSKRVFVAASRPKGKGHKLTMKIRSADGSGKSRAVRLWFRNRTEARYFQSCFET